MQILTVDIGTGTQDILLFDSERSPENYLRMVVPAPTMLLARRIGEATAARLPLLITGVIMGGGPCSWAVEAHRRAGLRVLATPDAARTFNDDLKQVQQELGVEIITDQVAEDLARSGDYFHVEFRDFDYQAILRSFAAFGVALQPDALALAVFDHGAAPPGVSDRQFRMDYLVERLNRDRELSTFAFSGPNTPEIMTRLRALAEGAEQQTELPVVVMDTAPAAILGALEDPQVAAHEDALIVNVGNFHTLAFQFRRGQFVRLFEHHTGLLTAVDLVAWLRKLADGSITHESVFAHQGHGALALDQVPVSLDFAAVVGPRRAMLRSPAAVAGRSPAAVAGRSPAAVAGRSPAAVAGRDADAVTRRSAVLPVYFAVPHGDQMFAGCFGLLRACADLEPTWRESIVVGLSDETDRSLW
jgi:uncharacterized protein (DUF1786 family)